MEVIMNDALSFLISLGITAFGIWIVSGAIAANSPLGWLVGLLTVIVGLISLDQATRYFKSRRLETNV
jgi:hypothetical protein